MLYKTTTTTIQINEETKKRLNSMKLHPILVYC